jgi:hypothetical protein
MKKPILLLPLLLATACATSTGVQAKPRAEMLSARTLDCTLGRALNLDPSKAQTIADIRYEGAHRFTLFLPPAPVHSGPLPEPTDPAEPVDPATRIVADPSSLASDMTPGFLRVIDLWPRRVEMIGAIRESMLTRLIIISDIDPDQGTANLFMTRAADAGSLDLDSVYQGGCQIESSRVAGKK